MAGEIYIAEKLNSVNIAGHFYQTGADRLVASNGSGTTVTITDTASGTVLVSNAPYDKLVAEDGTAFGASQSAVVTALNAYFTADDPDGIVTERDNLLKLSNIDQTIGAAKQGSILLVGSSDGAIEASTATLSSFLQPNTAINTAGITNTGTISSTGAVTTNSFVRADYLILEGSTEDNFETTLTLVDPTQDNTITLPDASGTVALTTDIPLSLWTQTGNDIYYNTGNVGIGTTAPSALLHVDGKMRFAGDGSGGNYMEIYRLSNNSWRWNTSGVGDIMQQHGNVTYWKQDFRVERAGLTVAPTLGYASRAINIDHTWDDVTRDFATIDIDVTDTASSGNSSFIDIAKGGTTGFIVDEDFNVGIGKTSPSVKLDVVGNTYLQGDVSIGPQASAGLISGYTLAIRDTIPSIYLKDQTGVVGDGRLHVNNNIFSIGVDPDNVTADAALRFETRGSERMRIDADGNVGIGTTTPSEKLTVVLDGRTYPSLQVGEVIKLKPSDNGTGVPSSDNAAVYIDRGGSTSTDVVALNVGDKLRIKRNGGGTPTFDVDNGGFIYTQNYNGNTATNTNPFNNGAGMGIRNTTQGSPVIMALLINGTFGALNTAGSTLNIANPNGMNNNWAQEQNVYFRNSGTFGVRFGNEINYGTEDGYIIRYQSANTDSVTDYRSGLQLSGVPNIGVSTNGGRVNATNGSNVLSAAALGYQVRNFVSVGDILYVVDASVAHFGTSSTIYKHTVTDVDYDNDTITIDSNYAGTTGTVSAFIERNIVTVRNWDGDVMTRVKGTGEFQIGNDTNGYQLPAVDGNEAQILSTDGAGNVSWIDGYNLQEQVKNVSGGTLYRGTPVHVTGSTGQQSDVVAANATTNYPAHYILDEDLTANASGRAVLIGAIQDVDLTPFGDSASNYSEADTVYLGASGGFVTTKPSFPNKLQQLGVILKVNTSGNQISGMITGMGQESPLLGDLNDVTLTNPATGQLISYNAAIGWYNVDSLTNLQSVSTNSLSVTGAATINAPLSVSSLTLTGSGTGTFSVGSLTSDLEILSTGNVRVLLDNDNNETGQSFTVQDPSNTVRFEVTDTGVVTLNDAYSFPNYDGAANQILATNGSGVLSWVTEGSSSGGGASTLNDLSDVTIGSVSNGNILVYNSTSSVWEPATPSSNVNADWDSTSGDSQILNKPSLATVATSGSYNDLTSKPFVPEELGQLEGSADDITEGQTNLFLTSTERTKLASVDTGAEPNVNADWDSTTGDSQILNKPTIPTELGELGGSADEIAEGQTNKFFTDGERTKLSGIATGAEVNVNADWNATSGDAQILNKPTIPPAAPVDSVNSQTGVVVLDADDIDDTSTTNKFTDAAGLAKLGNISVTQAVNLDTLESDVATNNAKVGITTQQASDITTNNAKNSYPSADASKLSGIEAGAQVNVNADWNSSSGDSQILNKPTIPSDIGDLSDVPATLGTAGQVLAVNSGGTALEYVDQSGGGGVASDADIQLAYKTTDQTITGTFSAITAWNGEYYDDLNNFDPTTGTLTITQAGTYFLQVDVMTNLTSGTSRSESQIYLEFNGSEVAGSRRGMYNRTAERGTTSASIAFPYNHTTGTATFKVMVAQTGGTDTLIVDNAFFSSVTLGGAQGVQGVSGDAFEVAGESAGRTLVAGDHLNYLRSTSATAVTFTVPPQSSVAWVDNAEVVFEQAGAGQITIAAGSGVTINSSETLKSGQQYAVIGLKRVASDTWTLTGERELA